MLFNDNTDTYTAAATDAMNYQIVTGSTGTSISISFIEVYGNATPAAAATGPKYQHNVTHAEEAFRLFLDKRRKEKKG